MYNSYDLFKRKNHFFLLFNECCKLYIFPNKFWGKFWTSSTSSTTRCYFCYLESGADAGSCKLLRHEVRSSRSRNPRTSYIHSYWTDTVQKHESTRSWAIISPNLLEENHHITQPAWRKTWVNYGVPPFAPVFKVVFVREASQTARVEWKSNFACWGERGSEGCVPCMVSCISLLSHSSFFSSRLLAITVPSASHWYCLRGGYWVKRKLASTHVLVSTLNVHSPIVQRR